MKLLNVFPTASIVTLALTLGAGTVGCVKVQQVAPGPDSLLPSVREIAATNVDAKPFTGLRVESRLAGSLIDLQFAPGLDVTAVTAGSPAEAAGIHVGDRITKANGAVLETIEQFDKVLAASKGDELELEVERDQGVNQVRLTPRVLAAAGEWKPARFAERLKGRFVAETLRPDAEPRQFEDEEPSTRRGGCWIVELLPDSPFQDADIAAQTDVFAIDGRSISDARDFAQEIARRNFGDTVTLEIDDYRWKHGEYDVTLWSPPRRITGLSIPILFTFERDLAKDEVSFEFIDLWIVKLYGYARESETRRHEFLWFTIWESGVGALSDEGEDADADGPAAPSPDGESAKESR